MNILDNLTMFSTSSTEGDSLEALVRQGAKIMLQAALQAEVNDYLQRQPQQRTDSEKPFAAIATARLRSVL